VELERVVAELEEEMWAVEERLEVETDKTARNYWAADLARIDQELAELRTYCC